MCTHIHDVYLVVFVLQLLQYWVVVYERFWTEVRVCSLYDKISLYYSTLELCVYVQLLTLMLMFEWIIWLNSTFYLQAIWYSSIMINFIYYKWFCYLPLYIQSLPCILDSIAVNVFLILLGLNIVVVVVVVVVVVTCDVLCYHTSTLLTDTVFAFTSHALCCDVIYHTCAFLGHLLRDDPINLVKMSVRPYVHNQTQCSHKPNSGIC